MNRKTFLKSLLGLAVAPMALAKIIPEEKPVEINQAEIHYREFCKAYDQHMEDYQDMVIYGMPRRYIGEYYPTSPLYKIKGLQDYINSYHSTILKGIKK